MSTTDEILGLRGKVAIVTGGYSGLGAAITIGLAKAGAKVAATGYEGPKALAFAERLRAEGHDAYGAYFNVLSQSETQRMADDVAARFGRVDILINSAGVNREQSALELTEQVFDSVIDVNLRGAMFQAQAAARYMIRQGGGAQVHLCSVRSQLGLRGRGYAAYTASKGGLAILCKQLAAEWAPYGINVNAVAPTFVNTEMSAPMLLDPQFRHSLESRVPLGRIAEPEDVMRAALFLASPAAAFVTGQILYVDGGITATQ
jgi:NAD(P)-dependent dehydrogenase (short-subunit alcohol dehydrogenase family)